MHLTSSYIILHHLGLRNLPISIHFHTFPSLRISRLCFQDGWRWAWLLPRRAPWSWSDRWSLCKSKKKAETWYFSRMTGVLGEWMVMMMMSTTLHSHWFISKPFGVDAGWSIFRPDIFSIILWSDFFEFWIPSLLVLLVQTSGIRTEKELQYIFGLLICGRFGDIKLAELCTFWLEELDGNFPI